MSPSKGSQVGNGNKRMLGPTFDGEAWPPTTILFTVPIRVVLADDNYLLREGVRQLIETQPELELAAVAADLDSLMAAGGAAPAVVGIPDIPMPTTGTGRGIRTPWESRAKKPRTGAGGPRQ